MTPRLMTSFAIASLIAAPTLAQVEPSARPTSLSALVEKADRQKLAVKTEDGKELTMTIPADVHVTRSRKATIAEIKSGQYIGCTAIEGPGGELQAQEIHIMPEAMRDAGGGHFPWELRPRQQ